MEKLAFMGKLFLTVGVSKKDRVYRALTCDLGYTIKYLTFDIHVISECLGISISELLEYPVGLYEVF